VPFDCVLAEAVGTLRGPAAFLLARRRGSAGPRPAYAPAAAAVAPADVRVVPCAPPASVVVPSHNRRDQLLDVLAGLARQTARQAMEVVVVLDGCHDGSANAVREIAWPFALKVVEQPTAGVAAARNRGALEASHDLLVLLDDDLVPAPHMEERLSSEQR
jgi:cellulose synthase/poly-beta-1,6-N-acetylglucosamine synthase-like glycosyltransferase